MMSQPAGYATLEAAESQGGRLKASFYFLLTAMAVIGLPAVLVYYVGWPFPTSVPDLQAGAEAFTQRNFSPTFFIKTLAVILWITWFFFVVSLLWELFYVGPKLAKGMQAGSTPLIGPLVARLVAGMLSAGMVATSLASNSVLPTDFVPTEVSELPEGDVVDEEKVKVTAEAVKVWRVMPGDTLWTISNGNERIMNAIFEANPGIYTALDVKPGVDLTVPNELEVPENRLVSHVPEEEVVIERGDHLWGIAERRLETALVDGPTNKEVADYVSEVVERNPEVQDNPDLIFPGDTHGFPGIGEPEPTPAESGVVPTDIDRAADNLADGTAERSSELDLGGEGAEPDDGFVVSFDELTTSPRGVVLGAGLYGLLLTARRRQLIRGAYGPLNRRRQGNHQWVKAGKLPYIEWAGKEVSKVVEQLRGAGEGKTPSIVEVRLGNGLEIIWQQPQLAGVTPWNVSGDGRRWRREFKANSQVSRGEMPVPFPALVTVGSRSVSKTEARRLRKDREFEYEQSVMVDLTEYPSMALVGSKSHVQSMMRSIVLELGSSEILANAKVMLVDVDVDGVEHMPRVEQGTPDQAAQLLRAAAVASTGFDSLPIEAAVFVVGAESPHASNLVSLCQADSRCAVLVVGPVDNARRHLVVGANGEQAYFLDNREDVLKPVMVSADDARKVAEALAEEAGDDAGWVIEAEQATSQAKAAEILKQLDTAPQEVAVPADRKTIHVLGEPTIPGLDLPEGAIASVLYVLSVPTRAVKDFDVITAIWGEGAVDPEEFWQEITLLRKKLGSDAVLRTSDDELSVSAAFQTDLEIFASYVRQATGADLQTELEYGMAALQLVRGVPFSGSALCHWAYRLETPLALKAIELIETTALRVGQLAIDARLYGEAEEAIALGLAGTGPNEPLLRMGMKVEALKGNVDGVDAIFGSLGSYVKQATGESGFTPSKKTADLHEALTQMG